jgi:hypothetical protein
MAYMSQDQKKTLAPGIKGVLTKYGMKGTTAVRNHCTLVVNVTEGPLDLIGNANAKSEERCEPGERRVVHKDYIRVSNYHARDQFSDECQAFVLELLEACNVGNWDKSDLQADYHNVGWYVDINIGRYDWPYTLLHSTHEPEATAKADESVSTTERDYGGAFDGFTVASDANLGP